jgi:23S rRNA pseudouridine955/2504/2580 synthase
MFLHAATITFRHPATGEPIVISSPLPPELARYVAALGPATR